VRSDWSLVCTDPILSKAEGWARVHAGLIWTAGGAGPSRLLLISSVFVPCDLSDDVKRRPGSRYGSSGAVAVVVRAVPSWGLDSVIHTVVFAALGFFSSRKASFSVHLVEHHIHSTLVIIWELSRT